MTLESFLTFFEKSADNLEMSLKSQQLKGTIGFGCVLCCISIFESRALSGFGNKSGEPVISVFFHASFTWRRWVTLLKALVLSGGTSFEKNTTLINMSFHFGRVWKLNLYSKLKVMSSLHCIYKRRGSLLRIFMIQKWDMELTGIDLRGINLLTNFYDRLNSHPKS